MLDLPDIQKQVSRNSKTDTMTTLALNSQLPNPCHIIKALNINKILKSFQNVAYIGVLRQRWEEIKKLSKKPDLALPGQ